MAHKFNYTVIIKDYYGKAFAKCKFAFISDAVKYFKQSSGWEKELLDNSTGEILIYDGTETRFNVLEMGW